MAQSIDYGRKLVEDLKQENKKRGKFPMSRKLAIAQSITLIALAVLGIWGCAVNDKDVTEKWIFISLLSVAIAGQIFNIAVHLIDPSYKTTTWLGLFIVRKKLEEKIKIENLTAKK